MSVRVGDSPSPQAEAGAGQGFVSSKDMGVCEQVHMGAVRGSAHDPQPCLQVRISTACLLEFSMGNEPRDT